MILHYLITAIRNLRRNLLYSLINIIGLTLGITSIIFVFAWILDETSYDKFHPNVDQMYRVEALMDFESPTLWTQTPAPLSGAIKKDFQEVLYSAKIRMNWRPIIKLKNQPIMESGFYYVTPGFFKIFGIETIISNPERAIADPYTILISESTAKKYFGSDNPIGKTLEVNQKSIYTVKGIFKDYPMNSHLKFNFIASFDNLNLSDKDKVHWDRYNYNTYVTLQKDVDVELFRSKLKNYLGNFVDDPVAQFQLQKVKEIHLYAKSGDGNIVYIYIFTLIGILVLAIAFINFINISTAKALERTKEIAIRKTHGATRKILRQQIFSELSFLVFIALVLSLIIIGYLIPYFNNISNKEFTIQGILNAKLCLTILALIIISVIASGFYPAIYLSSFDPGVIITNKNNKKKGGLLRKILVTVQLTISVGLILGAIIIQKQLNFIRNKNLGFNTNHLMYVNMNYKAQAKFNTVGENILQIGGIDSIAFSHALPVNMGQFSHISRWDGHMTSEEGIMVNEMWIDQMFLPVYGINIVSGRNFRNDDNEFKLIINQRAADKMGLSIPVGTHIYMGDDTYEIVGLTANFHFQPLSNDVTPILLYYEPANRYVTFRIKNKDIHGTIQKIEKEVTKILPEYPFIYGFIDEEIDRLYRTEIRIGNLVKIFTIIAVVTSCLGIFGLSAFMAESRTKEIGIRKTLGSSTRNIMLLMTRDTIIITIIANITGSIIGYRIISGWLMNFAYRIQIQSAIFIQVLFISLVIAIITISFHAVKSSRVNPAKILKYE